MENKLEEARKIINEVDKQMAELFVKRMRASELVYEHKKQMGLPILDEAREAFVIDYLSCFIQQVFHLQLSFHRRAGKPVHLQSHKSAASQPMGNVRKSPHRPLPKAGQMRTVSLIRWLTEAAGNFYPNRATMLYRIGANTMAGK